MKTIAGYYNIYVYCCTTTVLPITQIQRNKRVILFRAHCVGQTTNIIIIIIIYQCTRAHQETFNNFIKQRSTTEAIFL